MKLAVVQFGLLVLVYQVLSMSFKLDTLQPDSLMNNMLDVSDTSRTRQPSAAGWWEDRGERTTIKDKSRQQLMTCNSKNIRQHLFSCDCVTATDTPTPSISAEFEMSWRSKELSKFKVCVCTKNTYDSFSTFCPCSMIRRFEHKLYLI